MRTLFQTRAPIQFSTHNPENIIVIENFRGDRVILRAAHDNFSQRRKAFLVRQLAAEGYIPDGFEHTTQEAWPEDLIWVVDRSLALMGAEATRRLRRTMRRLILAGCGLWVAEMVLLLLFGVP